MTASIPLKIFQLLKVFKTFSRLNMSEIPTRQKRLQNVNLLKINSSERMKTEMLEFLMTILYSTRNHWKLPTNWKGRFGLNGSFLRSNACRWDARKFKTIGPYTLSINGWNVQISLHFVYFLCWIRLKVSCLLSFQIVSWCFWREKKILAST